MKKFAVINDTNRGPLNGWSGVKIPIPETWVITKESHYLSLRGVRRTVGLSISRQVGLRALAKKHGPNSDVYRHWNRIWLKGWKIELKGGEYEVVTEE
jgi:hypothetical protein